MAEEDVAVSGGVSTIQPGKGHQAPGMGGRKPQKLTVPSFPPQMLTRPLLLVTLISAFGSSVQYGYNAFVIFHPAKYIQNFFNETYRFRNVISIDLSLLWFQWGLTVAFFPFGGFCGALMAGPLVDSIGRKKTLLVNNLLAMIAAALVISTKPMRSHELLICSRFFVGICAGIAFSVVPMYLAEIAPQNLRGALCTVADLFITFGILLAEAIGFREVLGTEEALKELRCSEDVEQEMEDLRQEELVDKAEKDMDVMKILYYPGLRWHAQYYAKRIYLSSGVSEMVVWYISMALSLFLMVFTTLVICIVESSGRRILLLTGFSICSISCIFLSMSLQLQVGGGANPLNPNFYFEGNLGGFVERHFPRWLMPGKATMEQHLLSLQPDPVPNVLVAEYFLQTTRSTAFVIAGSIHWICKFLVIVTYLHMDIELEPYSFLFFWPFNIATVVYVAKMIPETKDRSFLEIRRRERYCRESRVRILVSKAMYLEVPEKDEEIHPRYLHQLIQDYYNNTFRMKKKETPQLIGLNFLYTLTSVIYTLGGLIGSLMVCPMADTCGR
ncbi:hypothetical protein Chor_008318 [Crotalus horridus]